MLQTKAAQGVHCLAQHLWVFIGLWVQIRQRNKSNYPSFIGLWVKLKYRNKSACSELNPVQSSKSKLTICPRKGRLLRFQSNSTATVENYLRHDQSLQPKQLQKIIDFWKPCKVLHWLDQPRISIQSKLKIIIYSVTDQPSITWSWRSVLNFKFSVLTFLK